MLRYTPLPAKPSNAPATALAPITSPASQRYRPAYAGTAYADHGKMTTQNTTTATVVNTSGQ